MGNRQQIQAVPGVLRITLEKGRAEFGPTVRKIRWGEVPILVCPAPEYAGLGAAAGYAFATFVGWPVATHPAELFQTYALPLLRSRSVMIMISGAEEWPAGQELARAVQKRDCTLVVLTNHPGSPLAKSADHVFVARADGDPESPAVAVSIHAALNFLAFEAARVLKHPEPQWDLLEKEFAQLGEKLDWMFMQFGEAVRSVAAEVARLSLLRIVGGGFHRFPAWRAARRMRLATDIWVEDIDASELGSEFARSTRRDDALLFLSGSHSKLKKLLQRCAAEGRRHGKRVLFLTDSNDREMIERSDLGILIPPMLEAPACTLSMFMLEWLAMELGRVRK